MNLGIIDARARLLRAALGFALVRSDELELRLLHRWLDTWRGIGDIVAGIARQEYDLELRRYDGHGWRAVFFQSGFEHSFTSCAESVGGSAAPCPSRLGLTYPMSDVDIGGQVDEI